MKQSLNPAIALVTLALLWQASATPVPAQADTAETVDLSLVSHSAVTIAAPPERIWPHIVDPDDWKAGAQLLPIEGSEHRFKAVMPGQPDTALFHVTNVEFDPPARRTIRLNALDGALIGFASWELTPTAGGTRVAYHVYSQQEAPAGGVAFDREAYVEDNRKRFQDELNRLEELVEQRD